MKPWQEDVLAERFDLERRRENLRIFIQSEDFAELQQHEQHLLRRQLAYMEDYANVLRARILGFEGFQPEFLQGQISEQADRRKDGKKK